MRVADYKDLRVYQAAFDAAMRIFELTKTFPAEEKYSLIDQIRRSSRSVCSNSTEDWRKRRYEAAFVSELSGSDEKTGWSENTIYDGTGIEDPTEFDYEDWKRRELGSRGKMPRMFWIWWLVAVGLAIFFLWAFVLKRIVEAL